MGDIVLSDGGVSDDGVPVPRKRGRPSNPDKPKAAPKPPKPARGRGRPPKSSKFRGNPKVQAPVAEDKEEDDDEEGAESDEKAVETNGEKSPKKGRGRRKK